MLTVETIRKIRLSVKRDGKSIRETAKDLRLARNTVRKAIRSEETSFEYQRLEQPRPKLGAFVDSLEKRLSEDQGQPKRRRRTAQVLYEELQGEGYAGGYDSVRRYVAAWRRAQRNVGAQVFIPLVFEPAEAFQFDWSHEDIKMAGMPMRVKVAHLRLCYSRLFLVVAYPRETQEMVFDAHMRGVEFFGGVCRRGIYDNLKTVVNKILKGKQRSFNNRFGQLCSHYLFEPVACTPAAGWEKGQVENQVRVVRRRFFTPRLKVNNFKELNERLRSQCLGWAKTHKHPTITDKTVWQVYEQERSYLTEVARPFDGYGERPARVSPSSLVTFDNNRYSVECSHVGRAVQLRAYADKVVIVSDGNVVGLHEREFGRGKTVFDPWHYLPVLERKPGALRNGAPFKSWILPEALTRIRNVLERRYADWDRQFVAILTAIPLYGLETITWACKEAMSTGTVSKEVVLNIVSRSRDEHNTATIDLPAHLKLKQEPVSDCRRYDSLLREARYAAQ